MPYYKIRTNQHTLVLHSDATLAEMREYYKDALLGECDQFGNVQVAFFSIAGDAALQESAKGKAGLVERHAQRMESLRVVPVEGTNGSAQQISANLKNMNFSRTRPTSLGGFIVPLREGIMLNTQVDNYRRILNNLLGCDTTAIIGDPDLLKVMPQVLKQVSYGETAHKPTPANRTTNEGTAMDQPIIGVAEFKAIYPDVSIEVYHEYLRDLMGDCAKKGKPFMVTDQDTLNEVKKAIYGTPHEMVWGPAMQLSTDEVGSPELGISPESPNLLGDQSQAIRKDILKRMDLWWVDCQAKSQIEDTFGIKREAFIAKEYLRYRKYVKGCLKEIIEPNDTSDLVSIDTTQWNTFSVLGKMDTGEWFRPLSLTFNIRGHFELFEDLDDAA